MLNNAKKFIKKGLLTKVKIKKKNWVFSNPVVVLDVMSGGILKVKIAYDTDEYKKDEILKVNYKFLNLVNEKAWENIIQDYNNPLR